MSPLGKRLFDYLHKNLDMLAMSEHGLDIWYATIYHEHDHGAS